MKFIATTSQAATDLKPEFRDFLQESKIGYVPRQRQSLKKLIKSHQADGAIVWHTSGPILHIDDQKLFFHPSMAKNRIGAFRKNGQPDLLVKACNLQEGDDFLDCTLGLGADAIVASYFSRGGRILGLESSYPVGCIIKWGMKLYQSQMPWLDEAIKRIEVVSADHNDFLPCLPDKSFDIVYFDPMFRHPLMRSQPIASLRSLADHRPLALKAIEQACRVGRKRVVVKELAASSEFQRLGITKLVGSTHNKITYGVIEM